MGKQYESFALGPIIRMDEFVTKDLAKREAVLAEAFMHLGVIDNASDARLPKALEVFNENSQKNSAMGGAKKGSLSDESRQAIYECVLRAAPCIPGVFVEKGGANVLLEGSLGACSIEEPEAKKSRSE